MTVGGGDGWRAQHVVVGEQSVAPDAARNSFWCRLRRTVRAHRCKNVNGHWASALNRSAQTALGKRAMPRRARSGLLNTVDTDDIKHRPSCRLILRTPTAYLCVPVEPNTPHINCNSTGATTLVQMKRTDGRTDERARERERERSYDKNINTIPL